MDNKIIIKVHEIKDISPEKRFLVDELTIDGIFDVSNDLPILRQMCNTLIDGKRTGGHLSYIDISQCEVRGYRISSLTWVPKYCIPDLRDCISLKTVILSSKSHFSGFSSQYFSGCKSLEAIKFVGRECHSDPFLGYPYDLDGVLCERINDKSFLVKYPANKGTEYKFPLTITNISDYAFEDSHLTSLYMPSVPPSCGEKAFYGVNTAILTIYVHKDSFNSYWMHPIFGHFNIKVLDD